MLEDIPNKIQNKLGIVADVNLLNEGGLESTMHLQVIEKIKSNPHITQKDLVSETNIPLRTMQRITKELQGNGRIERKGGKRYGYWEVHEE